MSPENDWTSFRQKELAELEREIARTLAWAKRPGTSDRDLRNLCRALFHLLRCRQMALTWCDGEEGDGR
jgi:hypothetical protein